MIVNESMISSTNMYPYIYASTSPKASNTVPKLTALRGTWDSPGWAGITAAGTRLALQLMLIYDV